MNEMLGNHYFQLRDYPSAEYAYTMDEARHDLTPESLKRVIICYTQTNKIPVALNLLYQLIKDDITTIVGSNQREDDCPCLGLIRKIESGNVTYTSNNEKYAALGILWLYCDIFKSMQYFRIALPGTDITYHIKDILQIVENFYHQSNNKSKI